MSTAEELNYHDGFNKPATMIMVRHRSCENLVLTQRGCDQDSFRGNRDFDKSWLSGSKDTVLRAAVGKACDNARCDLKDEVRTSTLAGSERGGPISDRLLWGQIAKSVKNKTVVLTLTVSAVSRFSKHCKNLTAHEGLALRMAFLVSFDHDTAEIPQFTHIYRGGCISKTLATSFGRPLIKNLRRSERSVPNLTGSALLSTLFIMYQV
jgi:hypothetical protein